MSIIRATTLLLAILCGSQSTAADVVGAARTVALGSRDRAAIAQVACTTAGAARLDARAERSGAAAISVGVQCNPLVGDAAVPVARTATCTNASGTWRCEPGQDLLQVKLHNDYVLPVIAEGVTSSVAVEAVTEAAKLTIRPFYRPAARVMTGQCTVLRGVAAARAGMDNYRINCGEASIFLTKDCFKGKCRYFIPFALNY